MKYDTNTAYDLSLFEEPKEAQPVLKVHKAPQKKTLAQRLSRLGLAKVVALALVVLVVSSMMIYNQMILAELDSEIGKYTAELTELQTQYSIMQSQVESKVSLRAVEEYATEQLGMSKLEEYQISYVSLSAGDRIVKSLGDETADERGGIWTQITEYLSGLVNKEES